MNNNESILVTGAAGFIGSHLLRTLKEATDLTLIAMDDLSGGFRENLPEGIHFVEGSVTDHELVGQLFEENKIRYVYHLAAYAAEILSHHIRRFNYMNNLIGSTNLINESVKHGVECFVFTSSIGVYGEAQVPMREDMVPEPEDPYGIAKYAVEMDLKSAQNMFGLDYVIFRPHNVYGEYQNIGDKYRNVVGIFMNQILKGEPLTIFGDGEQQRAFSYVDDIAKPMAVSAWTPEARNRIFNIGADKPVTVNELARKVREVMGVPDHPVNHLPGRHEVKVAYSDHRALEEVFGKTQYTPLDEGLEKMARWVKETGVRSSKKFDEIEVREKLPSAWE